ncbi:type III secretion system protein [[Pantoea] beijingensis]|uniref:Type III secretion system protein n=1 Tax=[Pantoea] beijingensis TaxID=1324864 RepID=A0A443IA67_9GAMM|nr:type III secretion system export apparatus subunit SctU [[Pantoea] beijingensis]RWR00989.1 type III secretion system protein [[Pantoea] beijingensis]
MAEKTEKASPQKLQQARRKGQVTQSQDIPKLLIMLGVTETVFAMADDSLDKLQALLLLPTQRLTQPFDAAANDILGSALLLVVVFFMMTLGVAVLMRIIGGWAQFGPLFATEALQLKLDALNPMGKFKQMFSGRQLIQLLVSILKAVVMSFVFYKLLAPKLGDIAILATTSLEGFIHAALQILEKLSRTIFGVLLVFGIADYGIQKYFFLKQNRMSMEDVKNEYKQSEGDPHTKGHRKQLARELANEAPKKRLGPADIENADVLMINPTHFAVGLYYRPDETPLPKLLFKAEEEEVREVIKMAHDAKIPVIRYIWLTRTLHRTTKEGAYIPRETLKAVAQIYRLLRELEEQVGGQIIEYKE